MQLDPMHDSVEVSAGRPIARVMWALSWLALAVFAAEFVRHVYLKYATLDSPAYAMFLHARLKRRSVRLNAPCTTPPHPAVVLTSARSAD